MPKPRVRIPRRKRVFGTKSAMMPVVKTLKKQVNHLMRVDRNQIYTVDDCNSITVLVNTGVVTYLNPNISPLAYGAANDVATKAVVLAKSLSLTIDAVFQANCNQRMVIFRDTANKGALPTIAEIFSLLTIGGASISPIYAGYNPDNTQRFKIIYDRIHHYLTSNDATATSARASKIIRVRKSFKDLKMEYTAGSGTITDASKNQLFMFNISSSTNSATFAYNSRIICEPPKASQ
ncbi:MAG: capsid protein [Cressdnaviricota sp.]|nr:MAG: capsid protein [Cressdnaviricota sp.]